MANICVLTIAGSDSSGGAGIQADLRTFQLLDVRAMTALTAVTAQGPRGVTAVHEVPPEMVLAQIDNAIALGPPAAVKTGMLPSPAVAGVVADSLAQTGTSQLVVDPVMAASAGGSLMGPGTLEVLCARLLPLARVFTPNLPEASILLHRPIRDDLADRRRAARELLDLGPSAVVLKGGHAADVVDVYCDRERLEEIGGEGRVAVPDRRGTGCVYSAALTVHLAHGRSAYEAACLAKALVEAQLPTWPMT